MEYTNPAQMFQSTLKGRQVAVKIIRLYVPLRDEEPLTVSTQPLLFALITFLTSRTEVLQRGRGLETPPPPEYSPAPWYKVCLISEWVYQGNINTYLALGENGEVNRLELVCNLGITTRSASEIARL